MVTGGWDGWVFLETEIFDADVGSWVTSPAKLPRPMEGLRAVNIDDRVLIFGNCQAQGQGQLLANSW